jgi:hypothetical protein
VLDGEDSWAIIRGYLNFTLTTCDTREANNPAGISR